MSADPRNSVLREKKERKRGQKRKRNRCQSRRQKPATQVKPDHFLQVEICQIGKIIKRIFFYTKAKRYPSPTDLLSTEHMGTVIRANIYPKHHCHMVILRKGPAMAVQPQAQDHRRDQAQPQCLLSDEDDKPQLSSLSRLSQHEWTAAGTPETQGSQGLWRPKGRQWAIPAKR